MRKILFWPFVIFARLSRKFRYYLLTNLIKLREILAEESKETKEMLEIYVRYTVGSVTKKELKKANAQFRDVLKTAGLGAFLILPFAPITIPFIVKLGRAFGLEILPKSVKRKFKNL